MIGRLPRQVGLGPTGIALWIASASAHYRRLRFNRFAKFFLSFPSRSLFSATRLLLGISCVSFFFPFACISRALHSHQQQGGTVYGFHLLSLRLHFPCSSQPPAARKHSLRFFCLFPFTYSVQLFFPPLAFSRFAIHSNRQQGCTTYILLSFATSRIRSILFPFMLSLDFHRQRVMLVKLGDLNLGGGR